MGETEKQNGRPVAEERDHVGEGEEAGPMDGKVVLVTGATSGMGKVTATELAKRGATVIAVGRNPGKGAAVVDEIRRATGNGSVELMLADLSSMSEVRRLADEVQSRHDRLDVLVNNAGGFWPERIATPEGYETTFAVNHLAPFLLTKLLLPLLERGAPSRVVNVTSSAQAFGKIDFDDLQSGKKRFGAQRVYSQAKLAVVVSTYELARRIEGTGVTANVLEPGFVNTPNLDQLRGPIAAITRLARPFLSTPEEGARTSVYLASSPEVEGVTGTYFDHKQRPARSSKASYDVATAQRLWRASEELTGVADGRAKQTRPQPEKERAQGNHGA